MRSLCYESGKGGRVEDTEDGLGEENSSRFSRFVKVRPGSVYVSRFVTDKALVYLDD